MADQIAPEKTCPDADEATPIRPCPYAGDVLNREKLCRCCDACRHECAMDI